MIKGVIFDIGGVLQIQDVNGPLRRDVSETFDVEPEVFETFRLKYEPKLLKGEWEERKYWKRFVKETGTKKKIPQESLLLREYKKNFTFEKEVLRTIKLLKENGLKLACLTDTQKTHTEFNLKKGLYDEFEVRIFSHDTGMCKPNPKIYKLCLDKLGIKPEETIYIDDKEKNLIPANELEMQTILFINADQLRDELIKKGALKI